MIDTRLNTFFRGARPRAALAVVLTFLIQRELNSSGKGDLRPARRLRGRRGINKQRTLVPVVGQVGYGANQILESGIGAVLIRVRHVLRERPRRRRRRVARDAAVRTDFRLNRGRCRERGVK